MRYLLLPAAALVAVLGRSCPLDFSGGWADGAERLPCGVAVEWGPQAPDADGLCGIAENEPGADGSRVEFTDGCEAPCVLPFEAAGCFDPNLDLIYVEPAEHLDDTALAHEWRHRALWLDGRDLDYGHTGAEWETP